MALQEEFENEGNRLFRHRSYLPVILLAVGLLVYIATILNYNVSLNLPPLYWKAYEYLCLTVSLSGCIVRIYTVGHTPSGTSGRNTKGQVAESSRCS